MIATDEVWLHYVHAGRTAEVIKGIDNGLDVNMRDGVAGTIAVVQNNIRTMRALVALDYDLRKYGPKLLELAKTLQHKTLAKYVQEQLDLLAYE
jgi:hypothetical protein